ncbi:hypothetical protein GCM10010168_86140 [Actinoplanes ianthinogenes]|uniref:MarR family transcriptional regulator n=1 Tax=Actinoplanes ianthinogenes TaxID=122358 RepID=A0ABN6CK18_9ACTN|nr:hypothetical protein [Actinoplanes ianthinogenes]BCJ45345.1 hypothetical protein Aiant_60020 [Actinoplanes ianthinogenes]GGR53918.1 hypothetical protein GCM10010168_86140 [Actinoplanes ianthinogenes]
MTPATDIEIALLRDVAADRVEDDEDFTPMLLVDGERTSVAQSIWSMERRDLVVQPFTSRRWALTCKGQALVDEADQ